MFQLLMVVIAIALLAIVVAGGVNYLSADLGVRTETVRLVQTSKHSLEAGFSAYRLANRGVMPTPEDPAGDDIWRGELVGYLAAGAEKAPKSMKWRYVSDAGTRSLCLVSEDGATLSKAVIAGLEQLADPDVGAALRSDCVGSGAKVALVLPLTITE